MRRNHWLVCVGIRRQRGEGYGEKPPSGLLRPAELRDCQMLFLAGRAAEQEVSGTASSGVGESAESDLARATAITASASFGLDGTCGLAWRGMPETHLLHGTLAPIPLLRGATAVGSTRRTEKRFSRRVLNYL